jgi:hypothetical protein
MALGTRLPSSGEASVMTPNEELYLTTPRTVHDSRPGVPCGVAAELGR